MSGIDPSLHKALDLVLGVVEVVDTDQLEEVASISVDDLALAVVELRMAMQPPAEETDDEVTWTSRADGADADVGMGWEAQVRPHADGMWTWIVYDHDAEPIAGGTTTAEEYAKAAAVSAAADWQGLMDTHG